ncbi:MAG: hypothetical protein ACK50N_02085 [Flavobacteriales bacterium]
MKTYPILFSTETVQAILEGRKTQTRRVIKPQPADSFLNNGHVIAFVTEKTLNHTVYCPYGEVGDVLWVRETWCLTTPFGPEEYYFGYKTSSQAEIKASEKYDYYSPDEWKPSIHMPKEACRIFLQITNIRVERLKDISAADAFREGINYSYDEEEGYKYWHYIKKKFGPSPIHSFQTLWESINGEESWEANPWVWVIEFERTVKPENF